MNDSISKLEKAIFDTIVYFDIFNMPLTSFEIWKNLYSKEKCSLNDVIKTLDSSDFLKNKLAIKDSLYYLKTNEKAIQNRKANYINTYYKYKKALKFIKVISSFGFIKAVFIANSMAIDNANEESDIDLYIISKENKIWITRFITTGITKILKLRPTEKTKKDKICLTIFSDEKFLDIKKACKEDDIYYTYWINQVIPVYDSDGIYSEFIKQNSWSKENIQNIFQFGPSYKRTIQDNKFKTIQRKISNIFCINFLNKISKKIQIKIFPEDIKKLSHETNKNVVIDDTIIKLHRIDNREYYRNLFKTRTNEQNF